MEEFSALAARVAASLVELRGCLILSRDGLILGAYPEGQEGLIRPTWLRFGAVGRLEKGFVEIGDEIWTYVRRGRLAAFVVSGLGVRPGLVIDHLDEVLSTAEEIRAQAPAPAPVPAPNPAPAPAASIPVQSEPTSSTPKEPPPLAGRAAPGRPAMPPVREEEEETEVDRVALAQELSRLLQESGGRDENQ